MSASRPHEPVEIVDYDPDWTAEFDRLANRVRVALGAIVIRVEHVGSTAVPGLAAKPVIDLIVVVASPDDLPTATERLEAIGYEARGDRGIEGLDAFWWPGGEQRHHLYVSVDGADELRRMVAFRDYLRTHPDEAASYAELKRELAVRHRDDRGAYTDAKTDYVAAVLAGAAG